MDEWSRQIVSATFFAKFLLKDSSSFEAMSGSVEKEMLPCSSRNLAPSSAQTEHTSRADFSPVR